MSEVIGTAMTSAVNSMARQKGLANESYTHYRRSSLQQVFQSYNNLHSRPYSIRKILDSRDTRRTRKASL